MGSTSVRLFEERDIDFAHEMITKEQWNDTRNDIKRMFGYESDGCFVAEVDGESAGHIFSVSYGKLGWIGFLIVEAEYRGKGIGILLARKALSYLISCGVETVKLEAVPEIANLYRKLGFIDEYDSLRFRLTSKISVALQSGSTETVEAERIADIAGFDARYFGANRAKVLKKLSEEHPQLCFVSHVGTSIAGYIMCRKAETGYKLGPWVCDPKYPHIATALLAKCVERTGQNSGIFVGVPAPNQLAIEVLREFGFEQYSKSIRMRFGKKLTERVNGVFAIGGPMKG